MQLNVIFQLLLIIAIVHSAPYQEWRNFNNPTTVAIDDGIKDIKQHPKRDWPNVIRFPSFAERAPTNSAPYSRFGTVFRDVGYPIKQYASSAPLYVFDGRLYTMKEAERS